MENTYKRITKMNKAEKKFWNDYRNKNGTTEDLLDMAIFLIGEYRNLVEELVQIKTKE